MTALTTDIPTAADLLGISPWTLRKSINEGLSPVTTVRVGKRIVVPIGPLASLLGEDPAALAGRLAPAGVGPSECR